MDFMTYAQAPAPQAMSGDIFQNVNAETQALVTPIMGHMTAIYMWEKSQKIQGSNHGGDPYKNDKLECVHLIWNGSQPEARLYRTDEGRLKCEICGREIYTKFDDSAINICLDFRKVVEQIMYFGMLNNMNASLVRFFINLKKLIPIIAQIVGEFNVYAKREESNNDTVNNVGNEYRFRGITSGF